MFSHANIEETNKYTHRRRSDGKVASIKQIEIVSSSRNRGSFEKIVDFRAKQQKTKKTPTIASSELSPMDVDHLKVSKVIMTTKRKRKTSSHIHHFTRLVQIPRHGARKRARSRSNVVGASSHLTRGRKKKKTKKKKIRHRKIFWPANCLSSLLVSCFTLQVEVAVVLVVEDVIWRSTATLHSLLISNKGPVNGMFWESVTERKTARTRSI
jgi:hypothetical protein